MTDAIRGVTGTGQTGVNPAASPKTQTTGTAISGAVSTGNDLADVSQTQSLLETINAIAGAIPGVDQNRIAGIREAIANGTYQVDPRQIAKQLLNSEQGLPGTTSTGD